ncbi:MAG: ATP-binding protein [Desulfobacterales bacterium]|nr:ATP-binding protein [Desulfobacterales bacterium]
MKKKKRLVWQIFPAFFLIALASLAVAIWFASNALNFFFLKQTAFDLKDHLALLQHQIRPHFQDPQFQRIDQICNEAGQLTDTRFTVILPDGRVVGDSRENPVHMDNHADRPEIRAARAEGYGQSMRYSKTLDRNLLYVATAMRDGERLIAVTRAALPVVFLDEQKQAIQWRMAGGGLVIAVLVGVISLLASRKISRPIEELRIGAEVFASGELERKLAIPETEELASLAEAMNEMADQLDRRIQTVVDQRNELETVLASMHEGVVAINTAETIINMNQAAADMFENEREKAAGRSVQEVVRNLELQNFVREALATDEAQESDISLFTPAETILNIHSSPIRDSEGQRIGTLLVMADVTKLRRLENMRRDFVANVSHEIKTPLTAIKGYVETLVNQEVDSKDDYERFLGIINKHVNRLDAIVEDLLSLSRIERAVDIAESPLDFTEARIGDIIQTAVQVLQNRADEKNISIDRRGEMDLKARVDATLIEQAILNLLDNAIKYSDNGSVVAIDVERRNGATGIHITDHGCGIAKNHLSRLFERFYRVDKARSRQMGGTGLGLAIVKHIVQAHGGQVTVVSRPGRGSTFSVLLPS